MSEYDIKSLHDDVAMLIEKYRGVCAADVEWHLAGLLDVLDDIAADIPEDKDTDHAR